MLNIAICDDSEKDLSHIIALLNTYISQQNSNHSIKYSTYHSALDLLASMEEDISYDLIILDVLMPLITGLDAAKDIRKFNQDVKILFITSSSEFAVESYTVGAYFYVLKPIKKEQLFLLLDRVISEIDTQANKSFFVKSKGVLNRISFHRLEFAEVNIRTIRYHMVDGTVIEADGSMTGLERLLGNEGRFVKPHRSYLINMEYIDTLFQREIQMRSRSVIPMAKANYQIVKATYMQFVF